MLRERFPRSGKKYWLSKFGGELEAFCGWLDTAGYSTLNIRGHLCRVFKVLTESPRVGTHGARSRQSLHRAFGHYCTCIRLSQHFRGSEQAYARFLSSRGELLEVSPTKALVSLLHGRYGQYLVDIRGFSQTTIGQHQSTVAEFLRGALRGERDLATLTSSDVEQYLAKKSRRLTRQSMQHVIAHLRAFLRYAFAKGLIGERLDAIDTPRTYRDELPPRALPWSLVQKLLCSIDRSSKGGWRDLMILHLMAYYGLRPSEIAALRVDSIDCYRETCRVEQRKTQSDLILPLSKRTLALLQQYLRHGRPESLLPQLFLRVRRPSGALRHYAVCEVFYKRARQSGLPLESYSPYCLRHSFAMRLLERGVGVKAIGDLLGHRSLEATCVYLRLDTSALRTVALPVPGIRSRSARHA